MKLFSLDSPLYKFMQRLWDIVKLNFMWLVFSLPIVTIGCSTIAAFTVALRMTEDTEGDIVRNFFDAYKANLKQGIAMSFINLICFGAVYADFRIYDSLSENSLPFLIVGVLTAYLMLFSFIYVYPLLARYENTVFNSLRNSFRLAMKYFLRTFGLLLIVIFEFAVIFWNEKTLFVGLLIGPASVIYTISGPAMYIFRETEKVPGSIAEPDNNSEDKSNSGDQDPRKD